jgi:hypothetical protein
LLLCSSRGSGGRADLLVHQSKSGIDPLLQLLRVQAADRMLHHDQLRVDLARFCLRQDQALEGLGGNDERLDTALL